MPWFWSDQYDLKLKMVGLSQGHDQSRAARLDRAALVLRLLPEGRRVLAVDTVNRLPEFMLAKRLVGERIGSIPERLADDGVPLKSLLPAA